MPKSGDFGYHNCDAYWLADPSYRVRSGVKLMSAARESVTVLRVFVSSPGDVADERAVMDEVVATINDTDGQAECAGD